MLSEPCREESPGPQASQASDQSPKQDPRGHSAKALAALATFSRSRWCTPQLQAPGPAGDSLTLGYLLLFCIWTFQHSCLFYLSTLDCILQNKFFKKGNNQTHLIPNRNIPHGFLDLFVKILAAPSSFISPENSTSFYSNNRISSENTKMQNRISHSRQALNLETRHQCLFNTVPASHVLCNQTYTSLYRYFLMLTYKNVSFNSVKKPLLGWKHRISAALCYPQDLLPHRKA